MPSTSTLPSVPGPPWIPNVLTAGLLRPPTSWPPLVVTPGAVEKHISNIFSKLDLPATDEDHRRVLAVLAFLRQG